ncbi:MAG: adenosylcobinamide-GDP ribazoletransferase [Desulfitobacteriaceae bacterium]|nr:adenosylcobinamide-GDP ribazoletransferase [Desulfitobacteriaceae bacterium]MDD4346874.1 adenosylcobinamide-GDP ribazoletransferase [Desulfitobacteriaceae bacterium]MDD4402125.1 adenosylcobinamide-GDP ribazoletransferase [Desulfitobacteriaceae bacterium]
MELLLAVQFLTRLPVTVKGEVDDKKMARSMSWFALVGLLLGALGAGVHAVVSLVFALPVSNFFTLAFLIFITGNLHGDGLMDTVDGFFSGRSRDRMLEIMRDSLVGSHGVMAGILIVTGKLVLLGHMPQGMQGIAFMLALSLGRWSLVYGAALYPYARNGGGVANFTSQVGYWELFFNSVTVVSISLFFLNLKGIILLGIVFLGTVLLQLYSSKKIGGITGDTLGATNECIELLSLIVLLIIFTKF